jgi:nucleotide-binding universal stress UspA family protein
LFEKTLVPLDGSEHSEKALGVAIQIAKKFNGKIVLIHVYSVTITPVIVPEPATLSGPGYPVVVASDISKMVDVARETGHRILSDGERKVEAEGVKAETILVEGHVVYEVVRAAKEGNFDLIVIGARGISKIRELLLGSVTDGVIHHATNPVLVIK